MKKFKDKFSIPVIGGLVFASLDLVLWIWFVVYGLIHTHPGIFEEGLLGMIILHIPASALLPILGRFILSPFSSGDSIVPLMIFLFVVGIAQYFAIGYLLGRMVLFFKKKFGKQEEDEKQDVGKDIVFTAKVQKAKIVLINSIYLFFSLSIFLLIYEYLHDIFSDFARFKVMHPIPRTLMDMTVIFLWGVSSFFMYKYSKREFKKNKYVLIYTIIPLLTILITWMIANYF